MVHETFAIFEDYCVEVHQGPNRFRTLLGDPADDASPVTVADEHDVARPGRDRRHDEVFRCQLNGVAVRGGAA
mgnify:CR=1 FL=1